MKTKFASRWQYDVWLYVAILLVAIVVWCLVFETLAQPKSEEKFSMVVFSDVGNFEPLKEHLEQNASSITAQKLKSVTIEAQSVKNAMSYELISTRVLSCDVLVFNQSLLPTKPDDVDKIVPTNFFQPVTEQNLKESLGEEVFANLQLYTYKDQIYGIYLNGADGKPNVFQQQVDSTDNFILFFSHKSVNVGNLYNNKKSTNTAALDVVRYLMGAN